MEDTSQETIAYHEAGHAVMAVLLGGEVVSVSVDSESEAVQGDVAVLWKRSALQNSQQDAINQIKVALAGPIAEMVFAGEYDYLRIRQEHETDWRIALESLRTLNLSTTSEAKLLQKTVGQLYHTLRRDEVWSAIGDVADRLSVDEVVEGEMVVDTVNFWINR
jgi:hypothetical protein